MKSVNLKLTKKELESLRRIVGYELVSAIENSSETNNGEPEDVEFHKNNPHEISALKKLDKFLKELK